MRLYYFEKLEVWNISRELTKEIYNLTGDFPKSEQFGLISQIRRSSISVASNIAEGSARKGGKEQARFTEIAFGSLLELLNQLIISNDLTYISNTDLEELRLVIQELGNKLNKLRESQLSRQ